MKPLLIITTLMVAVLHFTAAILDLYRQIYWLDTLLHFIGGIWIALLIIYFFETHPKISLLTPNLWKNFTIILSLVMLIGVIWEIYEIFLSYLANNITCNYPGKINQHIDSFTDLFFDGLGASFITLIINYFKEKKTAYESR